MDRNNIAVVSTSWLFLACLCATTPAGSAALVMIPSSWQLLYPISSTSFSVTQNPPRQRHQKIWSVSLYGTDPSSGLLDRTSVNNDLNSNGTNKNHRRNNEPLIRTSEIPGLIQSARLNTIPMGTGLVALGAYGARHVSPSSSLPIGRLVLGMMLTAITTSGSMLINDYYDHRDGIDNPQTKPNRALVTGAVRPSAVKLVLKYAYALHLTLLCLIDSTFMRLFVLANTLLTYLYSVHLKPITGVKNLICATIVSMAVGLGAVSWGPLPTSSGGGTAEALKLVWKPIVAVAGLIWHREIMMDIKDCEGDASVGVQTLPVAFGRRTAYHLSLLPLLTAVAAVSMVGSCSSRSIVATTALLVQGGISLWSRYRDFDAVSLKVAIEAAPLWLLMALIALTSA